MGSSRQIFISATSADLRTCRHAVRKWVLAQSATPVAVDHYPPDLANPREWLREKMASCDAVLHVAGECYGPEPETQDAEFPRRSFAQLEYETARALRKPVHAFLCLDTFPFDSHEIEPVTLRSLQQAHRAGLIKPRKVSDTLDLMRQLKKFRLPVEASVMPRAASPVPKPSEGQKPRIWAGAVAVSLLTIAVGGAALAFTYHREQEARRSVALDQKAKEFQAMFAATREVLQNVANHTIVDWEFSKAIPADQRLDGAFAAVADDANTAVPDLHRQVARYTAAIDAGAEAAPFDRALAEFAALRLDTAVANAVKSAEQFHSQLVAEESVAQAARQREAAAGGRIRVRLTAKADAEDAEERSRAIRDQEVSAWMLAGDGACLGDQPKQAADAYQKELALLGEQSASLKWPDAAQCLAAAYFKEGLGEESESMLRKAIDRRTALAGSDHPANIKALQNLAILLYARHDFDLAEPIFRQVLEARQRMLGPDHADTVSAANNLAALLFKRGDFSNAEPLFRQVLETQERTLDKDDPALLATLNNLASVLNEKRDLAGAEALFRRVVEARTRKFGPDDPSTLASMSNLAAVLTNKGDFEHAEPLFRQILQIREQTLGLADPSVSAGINSLAVMFRAKGDVAAVEALFREILNLQEEEFGENDSVTLSSASRLANELYEEKKIAEAAPLLQRVLNARASLLGDDHPDTINSMKSVASLLQTKGDYAGAEPIYRRILSAQEHTLGRDHAETLATLQNLANLLLITGRTADAEPLLERALQAQERVLGKQSPETALTAYSLSTLRRKQGRFREALTFAREAVEGAQASLPAGDRNRTIYEQQLAAVETELASEDKKLLGR